ncbi:hypothetical protein BGZ70_006323, partial [Mortierella alpina]
MHPKDSRVRVATWRDIIRSEVFYDIWKQAWLAQSTEPVINNPFPPHQPLHDYTKLLRDQQRPIILDESGEEQAKSNSLRTCSSTFRNLIRSEHVVSGNASTLLERIEDVQSSISGVIGEIYTTAHMATLLIAQGGAHTEADGPAPHVGFDLGQLVPHNFRSERTSQWEIAVAPVSLQDVIEK